MAMTEFREETEYYNETLKNQTNVPQIYYDAYGNKVEIAPGKSAKILRGRVKTVRMEGVTKASKKEAKRDNRSGRSTRKGKTGGRKP